MAGQRLDRRHQGLGLVVGAAVLAACASPAPPPDAVPLDVVIAGHQLLGGWEWVHFQLEAGTVRRERERWRFTPGADARHLTGRYERDVLVRALDGVPFECNQRTRYTQRTTLTITAEVTAAGVVIAERDYATAPSPCDPGLRQLGSYLGTRTGDRLELSWDGGVATLVREAAPRPGPAAVAPLVRAAEPAAPAGRWRWQARSWTRAGLARLELEDWELAVGADGTLGGTYVRDVTVQSPDGAPLPCAGAPAYGFVDRYLVRGVRAEDGWRLEETAVAAGEHPCLAATPSRTLDAGTVTVDGDYLVVIWRGKRRQVLGRAALDTTLDTPADRL